MRPLALALGWALLSLGIAASGAAQPGEEPAIRAGQPLEEALLQLSRQGLKLVFTDRLVRPEMRVEEEPEGEDPREILDQLLAPHGLGVQEAFGETLIVVPVEPPVGRVAGTVREWRSGRPLARVAVRVVEGSGRAVTGADGRFGLAAVAAGRHFLEASRPGYIVQQTEIRVTPGSSSELVVELRPIPLTTERIDVEAVRPGLSSDEISTLSLGRTELSALPRLGEDLVRPLTLLPGTAGNDVSARFHVRGGRADEVMVQVDGYEILEPYHLKDFNSALSVIAPDTVGAARLLTGGFSAQFGDRMGGVLDLTTREPSGQLRRELALSALHAEAGSSGRLPRDRGRWLTALRFGSLDLAASVAHDERDPQFADAFCKIDLMLAPNRSLRGYLLFSSDRLDFTESLGEIEHLEAGEAAEGVVRFGTRYLNGDLWASYHAVFGSSFYLESRASASRVKRDRRGNELAESGELVIRDERVLQVAAFAQDWSFRRGDHLDLKWGFEARDLDVEYDYDNERSLTDPLAVIGSRPPVSSTRFEQGFDGEQYGVYLASRLRPVEPLTLEAGVRYDENTILDDEQFSPRISLAYLLGPNSRLTAAWGHFYQSQRVYELQVEDGETSFHPSERSEHRIVGFEHTFRGGREREGRPRRGPTLRVELYEHRINHPRPRFENLFDPISIAPEVEADRVRIAPESGRARGVEIFVSGGGRRFDWFASYAHARTFDRIDGRRVPRSIDQPDAVKLDLSYRSPWRWDFNVALEARSGWPTTAITAELASGEDGEGQIVPRLGPLYGERLPIYRRLDVRASRRFHLRRGELRLFVDVQNLTDARNVRGFEISFETADGEVRVVKDEELWSPVVPSVGVRWAF